MTDLPVKIRLQGLPGDIENVLIGIHRSPELEIVEASERFYPNRRGDSRRGRYYIEVLYRPTTDETLTPNKRSRTRLPALPGIAPQPPAQEGEVFPS